MFWAICTFCVVSLLLQYARLPVSPETSEAIYHCVVLRCLQNPLLPNDITPWKARGRVSRASWRDPRRTSSLDRELKSPPRTPQPKSPPRHRPFQRRQPKRTGSCPPKVTTDRREPADWETSFAYAYVQFPELQRKAWTRYRIYETGLQDGLVLEPLPIPLPAERRRRREMIAPYEQNKRRRLF